MFVRASTLVLAIAASVIASSGVARDTVNQCNVGTMQCCDQTMTANDVAPGLLGLLGIGSVEGLIGLDCNPIVNVLGGTGASCTAQAVCCSDTKNVGTQLVGIDCSPINLNL